MTAPKSFSRAVQAVLLDIEGTISPATFVHTVLFPYARERLDGFVAQHRDRADVAALLASVHERIADADPLAALRDWQARDEKVTELKALQGLIWDEGYRAGDLRAYLYADALEAIRHWKTENIPLYIYSSGSLKAQDLFFQFNVGGDLRPLFSGFFDTTTGPKVDPASYEKIASTIDEAPRDIIFLSDNARELEAADAAGYVVAQVVKDETQHDERFTPIRDFSELNISLG